MSAPRAPRPARPAVPSLADRARVERATRRGRRLRLLGRSVLAMIPLAALAWVLLASSWLAVDRVEVVGTGRSTPEDVRRAAGPVLGVPLARLDTGRLADQIAALRPVASVVVKRSWPGTLRVEVIERVPAAGVVGPGGVELLDAEGVAFATEPRLPAGVVRLQVAHPGPDDPTTAAALAVERELPESLRERVRIVRAASPSSVVLLLATGKQVVWGAPGDTAVKSAAAEALLRMPGDVFDVSAPGVVVRR